MIEEISFMSSLIVVEKPRSKKIILLLGRAGPPLSYSAMPIWPYILKGHTWASPYCAVLAQPNKTRPA